jgi:alpha-galactosidase
VTRVALIGAGSAVFKRHLLGDILAFPELRSLEIVLHDIDVERLATAEAIAAATARELGASPRITAHLDRRRALEGADYVLNMVQIGGHDATLLTAAHETALPEALRAGVQSLYEIDARRNVA